LRVVHVCRVGWPHVGGMESVVAGLAAALSARGHEVRIVTLAEGSPPGDDAVVRLPRVGPRRWPMASGLRDAVSDADVVHVHGVDGLADQLLWSRRRCPIGVSTHGAFLHRSRGPLKQLWMRTATRLSLGRADAVWFTSESDRAALAPARVTGPVIPDGVDVARFSRVHRQPEPGRWLVPGRLDVHKGVDDLIRALGQLRELDPRPFQVDVVGPDRVRGLRERLIRLARRNGVEDRIRFVGEVDRDALLDAMGRAELALFPSRHEGFGVALVEAMAAGVPVVASAIPPHDAKVAPGVDGFRADFRDPRAAALAIRHARGADLGLIGSRARGSAAAHGWDRRVLDWERAYAALLERS
jgi:alpha-1,3-mannosyltransferase